MTEISMEILKNSPSKLPICYPTFPKDTNCARLHGHSYHVTIYLSGDVGETTGWVIDFGDLKILFQPICDRLDHRYLNDIKGLENPTSENIARWIWAELKPMLPELSKVQIRETCTSGCSYSGD